MSGYHFMGQCFVLFGLMALVVMAWMVVLPVAAVALLIALAVWLVRRHRAKEDSAAIATARRALPDVEPLPTKEIGGRVYEITGEVYLEAEDAERESDVGKTLYCLTHEGRPYYVVTRGGLRSNSAVLPA